MDKFFKCDCAGHILHVEYISASDKDDFEEFAMGIYSIYNEKGTRRLKNSRLLGDVVLFNNASPKELDDFFDYMEKIIKNRKKAKEPLTFRMSSWMKPLDTSIKNLKIYLREKRKKEQIRFKKMIARNKKANRKKKKK